MRDRRGFYLVMTGALLAVVLIGFSRTFYFRALFDVPPIPAYLYAHGGVLTTWFVLVFVQACLVAAHRTDLHRRLGILTGGVAVFVVLISAFVVLRVAARTAGAQTVSADAQFIIIGDLVSLVLFTGFVGAGLRLRHRPDWHKRLMTMSAIIIVLPAVARLERMGLAVPVPAVLLMMLATLVVHDLVAFRRVHRATVFTVLVVVLALAGTLLVVGSAAGQAIVRALR